MVSSLNNAESIFLLNKVVDDPKFEGFALANGESLLGREDLYDDISPFQMVLNNAQGVSLADVWHAPCVTGNVRPENDFPCVNLTLPVFSERACDVLSDYLEPNGELLPLKTEVGSYFFYHITTLVDALDLQSSRFVYGRLNKKKIRDIEYFVFKSGVADKFSIFRIKEKPIHTIVSESFLRRVIDNKLNGFEFSRIWPIPKNEDWRTFDKRNVVNA